eukprot:GHVU01225351.1.p2 GENE.GHVU01225351.1~~GHVU01225351.1.p2  ORF type:complete len:140 (-),score=23.96 GHVU01225351.1:85-504(-)
MRLRGLEHLSPQQQQMDEEEEERQRTTGAYTTTGPSAAAAATAAAQRLKDSSSSSSSRNEQLANTVLYSHWQVGVRRSSSTHSTHILAHTCLYACPCISTSLAHDSCMCMLTRYQVIHPVCVRSAITRECVRVYVRVYV